MDTFREKIATLRNQLEQEAVKTADKDDEMKRIADRMADMKEQVRSIFVFSVGIDIRIPLAQSQINICFET